MDKPLVSVVMTTWNRARLLPKAIDSILAQTFKDWELIIVDDGSEDNTPDVVKEYMTKDERIFYYRQKHSGYAVGINTGCKLARGKFVAFQDDDDISLPYRLELEVKELLADEEVELVYGLVRWVDKLGKTIGYFPGMLQKNDFRGSRKEGFAVNLWNGCKIPFVTVMMKKRHIPYNGEIFESKLLTKCQDWLHNLEVAYEYRIVGLSKVLVEVNRDPSHQSMMYNKIEVLKNYRRVLYLAKIRIGPKMAFLERWNHFRKAWGYQYLLEALVIGGWKGFLKLLISLLYRPTQKRSWECLVKYLTIPLYKFKEKELF